MLIERELIEQATQAANAINFASVGAAIFEDISGSLARPALANFVR
jgi:hypothetical protein